MFTHCYNFLYQKGSNLVKSGERGARVGSIPPGDTSPKQSLHRGNREDELRTAHYDYFVEEIHHALLNTSFSLGGGGLVRYQTVVVVIIGNLLLGAGFG